MNDKPVLCEWDGEAFRPFGSFYAKRADRQFVVGQRYQIEARQERSEASHRGYFAQVREAWENLPEHLVDRFPSSEHLRKYALIRGGFYRERSIVTGSAAEAQRTATFIKPMDSFAVVAVEDSVVRVFTAKSQDYRSMDRAEFQSSRDAVLDVIAKLLGIESSQIKGDQAA